MTTVPLATNIQNLLDNDECLSVLSENDASEDTLDSQVSPKNQITKPKDDSDLLQKLTSDVIAHYDNSVTNIVKPKSYDPKVNEFDQLRKRVNYLKKKQSRQPKV